MAHFPKPFFKKARGLWYVEINRKQINLGPDREEAFSQYHLLMTQPMVVSVPPESLVGIIDAFLDWVEKHRAPDTFEWYRYRLQRFVTKYPDMKVSALRPFHVEEWVDDYVLANTTRRNYFRSIKTCLRWAKKQGRIDWNPIEDMEIPGADRKEIYVPPEEFASLMSFVTDPRIRDLMVTTYHTGCRPQESLIVTGKHVELNHSRWVFAQSEAKGKKAPRLVYLNDEAIAITKRLLSECDGRELFRNSCGRAWTTDAVNCAIDRIQVRMGKAKLESEGKKVSDDAIAQRIKTLKPTKVVKGVERKKTPAELRCEAKTKLINTMAKEVAQRYSLYALRHSWATNALKRDIDPLTVALLMGHKDPSTLARVYQHLSLSPDHMLDQAKKATG